MSRKARHETSLSEQTRQRNKVRGVLGRGTSKNAKDGKVDTKKIYRQGIRSALMEARVKLRGSERDNYLAWLNDLSGANPAVLGRAVALDPLEVVIRAGRIPFADELDWIVRRVKPHIELLAEFRRHAEALNGAFWGGRQGEVWRELEQIELEFGISFWLIETRIGLEQWYRGLEAQKDYAAKLKLQSPGSLSAYLAHHVSVRNEPRSTLNRYNTDIQAQLAQPRHAIYQTDLCIITALPSVEMEAISRLGWSWSAAEPIDDTTFVRKASFKSGANQYTALAGVTSRMGMVASALLASKLIEHARPRYLINAGICGGVAGKTNFGDVVLGDPCWDWQNGKHLADAGGVRFAIAPEQLSVPGFVRARVEQLRTNVGLWSEVRNCWPAPPETELKVRIGPMASGSAVLADEDLLEVVTQQHRNLLAIDMEAYGVYAAANEACFPRPTAFALKAVSDFANGAKDDQWQAYAAYTSAACVRYFFETYMHEIADLAGTG
jgi:nucleoside phosphorylase